METIQLMEVLRATMDPAQRQQAEDQLSQLDKVPEFSPTLLQVVMLSDVDLPVRQAGAIYLKNLLNRSWSERKVISEETHPFIISEQDRSMIRDNIIDAVVYSPDLIRSQLLVCVKTIMKSDFPSRCVQMMEKIATYLQNPDGSRWMGTLLSVYQLMKIYQYKPEGRAPLNEAMKIILPIVYQICVTLIPDRSDQSIMVQKQILKIFFAYIDYSLPTDIISQEVFTSWMEVFRTVIEQPMPAKVYSAAELNDNLKLWWKYKKWALRILQRVFEKYGSPGNVVKDYNQFAAWYLKSFSTVILGVLFRILDDYKEKVYILPLVLQHTLNYLNEAVGHAYSWKYLKPHMVDIIQNVIFPVLSYSEADEELWVTDPYEYIKVKFDIFETYMTTEMAAQSLLQLCCKKRKGMLEKTMNFVTQVLNSLQTDARQVDGALHMIGHLADILLVKKKYKDQVNHVLKQYIFPQFNSPRGHMRARACWLIQRFSEVRFKPEKVLEDTVQLITKAHLSDQDLPVKVQAATAIKMILKAQEKSEKYLEPNIRQITLQLLLLIRETKNDGLASVLQEIVHAFPDQLMPIAVEICDHLATTFNQMLDGSDEKDISAIGLLNTVDTLLTAMEERAEVMASLQSPALSIVGNIFTRRLSDLYEEALFLVDDLTAKRVSPEMWKILEMLYQVFQRDAFDYFADMMAALHNYVTVDTDTFLSNEDYITAIFDMCKSVLMRGTEQDSESHAAKLMEVIILQCQGRIDRWVPSFVELVFHRLNHGVKSAELRTMCLQVAISALCYNAQLFFTTLEKIQENLQSVEPIVSQFIKQWLNDVRNFLGIHDRRICILGFCTLLTLPRAQYPFISEHADKIMPSLIVLFQGLKKAREYQAMGEEEDEDDDDDEDYLEYMEQEVLSSDESDIDEAKREYMEKLEEESQLEKSSGRDPAAAVVVNIDDFNDDDSELYEETPLESYTSAIEENEIDEYIMFKDLMQNIQAGDLSWYQMLTDHLSAKQRKALQEIAVLADQRRAAAESKKIEQSGGYAFNLQSIPTSFKFGNTPGDQ